MTEHGEDQEDEFVDKAAWADALFGDDDTDTENEDSDSDGCNDDGDDKDTANEDNYNNSDGRDDNSWSDMACTIYF